MLAYLADSCHPTQAGRRKVLLISKRLVRNG